ncbi:MAG: hypothetical protein UW24_C0016G0007 [Parcubacteria group bacterium GW2011_GWA2_44_12]|nr:MAG: hypothetical protein UW24_C0016G0007 [Parcubacteria group bacterium GW2011_GWA2_44_12]
MIPEIPTKIYKRDIIQHILPYLEDKVAIILLGSRQVGKTYILYWLYNRLLSEKSQVYYLDLEESRYAALLNNGPLELNNLLSEAGLNLKQKTFVFIDEIQYLKRPSNFLKLAVDHFPHLKIIASGSSAFEIKQKTEKALVGRSLTFEVFGLSFKEFLRFKEYETLNAPVLTDIKRDELKNLFTEFALYGSYPHIVLLKEKEKKEKYLWQIIDTYLKKDIKDLAHVQEMEKFNKLLEVLASQSGQLVNVNELSRTCALSEQTVKHYLFILENTYVIKLVRPFFKNTQSELFKTPKIYFYDSGVAHLLWLKAIPPSITGGVFETAVFSEMIKLFGKEAVNFWRTKDKKEIDFIVREKNNLLPVEVKLNFAKFKPSAIHYFCKRYHLDAYKVVSIEGTPIEKFGAYPWEL